MSLTAFHLFPALPKELRDHIWLAALAPELPPRALLFSLIVRHVSAPRGPIRDVILLPGMSTSRQADTTLLARSTAASRTLGLTCREARAAVHRALPDRLPFRLVARTVDADLAEDAEYFMRFDGERDVVVMKEDQTTQENATKWLVETGRRDSFAPFRAIKNLGIEAAELMGYIPRGLAPGQEYCYCGRGDCHICQQDPLPRFLACFPSLRTFCVTGVSRYYYRSFTRRRSIGSVGMCACAADGDGDGKRAQHEWPLVRAMEGAGDWFILYREGECAFPPLFPLERIRRERLPGWPCRFEGLRHLEFRILRRLKDGLGPPVPRWERAED